jgi:hypothetical protein
LPALHSRGVLPPRSTQLVYALVEEIGLFGGHFQLERPSSSCYEPIEDLEHFSAVLLCSPLATGVDLMLDIALIVATFVFGFVLSVTVLFPPRRKS